MKLFQQKSLIHIFEIIFWVSASLMYYYYLLVTHHPIGGIFIMLSTMGTYALIVYLNAYYLIPQYFSKGKMGWYLVYSVLIITLTTWFRGWSYCQLVDYYVNKEQVLKPVMYVYYALINIICLFTSFLFRSALDYFSLHQQQEKLRSRHLQAELNLLKAQVQPHFLFNALHNIYSTAYSESPQTASQIEKLSGIMRYFIDEAQKEKVSIRTELNFISNYILLEQVRMRYPIHISEEYALFTEPVELPPMLLIPFIENVFKHGIDKRSKDNFLDVKLDIVDKKLDFTVRNRISTHSKPGLEKMGLKNLENRLGLLFGNQYSLSAKAEGDIFTAHLNFPL